MHRYDNTPGYKKSPVHVVDVAVLFSPEVIGNALAKLWVVDGQKLAPLVCISGDVECPITLEPIEKAALLCDGTVYEEAAIKRWLEYNNTVPCTGLPLEHRKILRLQPLKAAVEQFLSQNDMVHMPKSCSVSSMEKSLDHVICELQKCTTEPRAQVKKLESLEAHIVSAEAEMDRLKVLIAKARATAGEVTSNINALKFTCATRLQSIIRGFLAKREAKRRRKVQQVWRSMAANLYRLHAKYVLTLSSPRPTRPSTAPYLPTPMSSYAFPCGDGEAAPPAVAQPVVHCPYVYTGPGVPITVLSPRDITVVSSAPVPQEQVAQQSETAYRQLQPGETPQGGIAQATPVTTYGQLSWVDELDRQRGRATVVPYATYAAPTGIYAAPTVAYAAPTVAYAAPPYAAPTLVHAAPPVAYSSSPSSSTSTSEVPQATAADIHAPPPLAYAFPTMAYAAPTIAYPSSLASSISEVPQNIPPGPPENPYLDPLVGAGWG